VPCISIRSSLLNC